METMRPLPLFPTLPILAESLTQAGWDCTVSLSDPRQSYRGIRLYHGQPQLHRDVLYLLRPTETDFPVDRYTYLCSAPLPGKANHMICPSHPDEVIMDQILEVFSLFRDWEEAMDLLLYRSASLQELCELGAKLLENPVCIHDDWFVMTAMTADFAQILELEYLMSSTKGFIPRSIVEDFLYDSEYLETYTHHGPRIWQAPGQVDSLYVNLWDGSVYKGRLLVGRKNRDFLHRDFLVAEALTQRAVSLLRRQQPGREEIHRNMDDILFSLLQGKQADPSELSYLTDMLRWQISDRLACLRLKPQEHISTMRNQLLHSDLFQQFPGSYILMSSQEQCVILNLNQTDTDPGQILLRLESLCRNYSLYAGISFPVTGIRELSAAYYQAGAAIDHVSRVRSGKSVLGFGECAMEHLIRNLPAPLTPGHLLAPDLTVLTEHDRRNGTQYFETFREYLLQERDIPRTSKALIIHRTTLLYRLQKIQSLISADLEDPWQRLYLIFSLWLLEDKNRRQPLHSKN
ncbi:MAG: helix-turn-helix domain-containing protein [Oscillospiraceae bacterium]|nr:helix-turn-helix domain-containing protein [Oscillospiraceae bacterium]